MTTTTDPSRRSWVESAEDPATDFPIQNLPYGRFRTRENPAPRLGVAIGESIFDLRATTETGLLEPAGPEVEATARAGMLNPLMGAGRGVWHELRAIVSDLLDHEAPPRPELLVAQNEAEMLVPALIGDYTDFYCSIHHATNVGSMFRPDNPLMPNYKHLPVGYHGRASSIVASGTPVRRPRGQTISPDADAPTDAASRLLDYELEMGFFVGDGNALGERIAMERVAEHIFGMCIVNDWSARDVQKWEYQPLGPFNAKNFITTISPWVVTMSALTPFRVPGPVRAPDDPPVLDYLRPVEEEWGIEIVVEVLIASESMRAKGSEPTLISRGNFRDMYWTIAQMLVHHTSTGCNMRPGDLIGSGTISGPSEENRGCLLERTWRGQNPITLGDGTERKFLQDGDEVSIRAYCERDGARRIGFGECRGVVVPAGQ